MESDMLALVESALRHGAKKKKVELEKWEKQFSEKHLQFKSK